MLRCPSFFVYAFGYGTYQLPAFHDDEPRGDMRTMAVKYVEGIDHHIGNLEQKSTT